MIELHGVTKSFGDHVACRNVTLTVERGELLTLLGPSGCGKTTTLRCISGSVELDEGRILIDGRDITDLPSHKRNVGLVFQNFALFPHLSVYDNVAFPLRVRRMGRGESDERVRDVLRLVRLEELADRMPRQLSGGQQQRVSLARALSYRPDVVLFDEPLSNLDAKLRIEMRYEIASLQKELGFTSVYVTHDQEEALALSDRIAVMSDGVVHQVGRPKEVYREPASAFVASFLGKPNIFLGKYARSQDGQGAVEHEGVKVPVKAASGLRDGERAVVFVRPEDLELGLNGGNAPGPAISARVSATAFLGDVMECVVSLAPTVEGEARRSRVGGRGLEGEARRSRVGGRGLEWRVRVPVVKPLQVGEEVSVRVPEATFRAFPAESFGDQEP